MGLGMGGLLRQVIETDPWGAEAWDTAQRLRVFVHLLHARDYAALTDLAVPPTPVTPEAYVKRGIPWFDWEAATPGVQGGAAFSGVKPVSAALAGIGALQLGDATISPSSPITLRRVLAIEPA